MVDLMLPRLEFWSRSPRFTIGSLLSSIALFGTMNGCFVNHFNTGVLTGVTIGFPVPIASGTGGWLLPRCRQDHLLVACGVPLRVGRNRQGMAELLALSVSVVGYVAI